MGFVSRLPCAAGCRARALRAPRQRTAPNALTWARAAIYARLGRRLLRACLRVPLSNCARADPRPCCTRRSLYNNLLNGMIPSELGALTALTYLCAAHLPVSFSTGVPLPVAPPPRIGKMWPRRPDYPSAARSSAASRARALCTHAGGPCPCSRAAGCCVAVCAPFMDSRALLSLCLNCDDTRLR